VDGQAPLTQQRNQDACLEITRHLPTERRGAPIEHPGKDNASQYSQGSIIGTTTGDPVSTGLDPSISSVTLEGANERIRDGTTEETPKRFTGDTTIGLESLSTEWIEGIDK
jgi:hypothetical protein